MGKTITKTTFVCSVNEGNIDEEIIIKIYLIDMYI